MATLQKIVLGTPPKAEDGDPARTASVKANANVDVLNTQAALVSYASTITSAQALTNAHIGKRVNISLSTAGTVNVPAASTCAADQVTLLRNIGSTVVTLAVTAASGDTLALSRLNPGESVLLDTDGAHTWRVLMRGRSNSDDETVDGNLSVAGTTAFRNDVSLVFSAGTQRGVNWTSGSSLRWRLYTDGADGSSLGVARYSDAGAYVDSPVAASRSTGVFSFGYRPIFAGNTPWDTGNLASPATLNTAQSFTASKVFSQLTVASAFNSTAVNNQAFLNGSAGYTFLSFGANSGSSAGSLAYAASTGGFAFYNYNASGYVPVICSTLTQTSDRRLKADIETISGAMDLIRQCRGIRYTDSEGRRRVGVIAQEVQTAFPEVVDELPGDHLAGPRDADESPFLGVQYQNMVGPLLQALIETDAALRSALQRIDALEAKVQ